MTVIRRLTEGDGVQLLEDPVLQRLTVGARREVVAYLADLLDATRPDRGAGLAGFNPAVDYPAGTVGHWLKAILTGIGEGQPWADVDALLSDLQGRLGTAVLDPSVVALLEAIDEPGAGVMARLDDLQAAYGTTVAAAESAIAAAAAATAAETAKLSAETAAGSASTLASTAASSATSASGSASTASTKASDAASSANTAGGHAIAAATSATTASTSATNAGTSAAAASTAANTATTRAAEAQAFRDEAVTASTTAAGSAATATTQAGIASTASGAAASYVTVASSHAADAVGAAAAAATHYNNTVAATGALSASVEELSTAVSGPNGVTAQQVFKVTAQRDDGKKVFGAIGVAATAPNDATGGQSEIILQSDRVLFVPPGQPNATPIQYMEVGLVDGVPTLRVPAARIGDLTVGTLKIVDGAVRAMAAAELISDAEVLFDTDVCSVNLDSSGAPVWLHADYMATNFSSGTRYFQVQLIVNGAVVRQFYEGLSSGMPTGARSLTKFVAAPGSGALDIRLRMTSLYSSGSQVYALGGACNLYVSGSKR